MESFKKIDTTTVLLGPRNDIDENMVHSALIWGFNVDEVLVHSVSGVRDIEPVIDNVEGGYPDRNTYIEYWRRPE